MKGDGYRSWPNYLTKAKAMHMIPVCLSVKEVDIPPSVFFMTFGKTIFSMGSPIKIESTAFYVRSSEKLEESNCSIKKMKTHMMQ